MTRDVRIFRTTEECVRSTAEFLVAAIASAVTERGRCFLALSGGATPGALYRLLASPPVSRRIDWGRVHLFFVDERCVPPGDPRSNFGMIRDALLSRIPLPPEQIHRIRGEIHAVVAADEYRKILAQVIPGVPPVFDLILLGVGEDGHTASLFPGTDVVGEKEIPVRGVFVPQLASWRVTLTRACLENARQLVFFVTGGGKAAVLRAILEFPIPGMEHPASLVTPRQGAPVWMLDAEAASRLDCAAHPRQNG